jgi:hypothetical protein
MINTRFNPQDKYFKGFTQKMISQRRFPQIINPDKLFFFQFKSYF